MRKRPMPVHVTVDAAIAVLPDLQDHIAGLLDQLGNRDLAIVVRSGDRRAPHLMATYEQNLPDGVYDKPAYDKFKNLWRVLLAYQAVADGKNNDAALVFPWMAADVAEIMAHGRKTATPRASTAEISRRTFRAALPLSARVSPAGLRERARLVEPKLNDSGSCANHLRNAATRIEQLEAFARSIHDWVRAPARTFTEAAVDAASTLAAVKQLGCGQPTDDDSEEAA